MNAYDYSKHSSTYDALNQMRSDHQSDWSRKVVPSDSSDLTAQSMHQVWGRVANSLIVELTQPQGLASDEIAVIENEIKQLTDQIKAHGEEDVGSIKEECEEIIKLASPILSATPSTQDKLRHLVDACKHTVNFESGEENQNGSSLSSPLMPIKSKEIVAAENKVQMRRLVILSNQLLSLIKASEKTDEYGNELPKELQVINSLDERLKELRREIAKLEQSQSLEGEQIEKMTASLKLIAEEIVEECEKRKSNDDLENSTLLVFEKAKKGIEELNPSSPRSSTRIESNIQKSPLQIKKHLDLDENDDLTVEEMTYGIAEGHNLSKKGTAPTRRTDSQIELSDEIIENEQRPLEAVLLGELALIASKLNAINFPDTPVPDRNSQRGFSEGSGDFSDDPAYGSAQEIQGSLKKVNYTIRNYLFHIYEGKRADKNMRNLGGERIDVTDAMVLELVEELFTVLVAMRKNKTLSGVELINFVDELNSIEYQLDD